MSALKSGFLLLAAAFVFSATASAFDINKSITIEAGTRADSQSTVNGSIAVGEGAIVDGSLETVNGTIRVEDNAQLGDAETVNGSISIGSGVTAEDLGSVNGAISLGQNVTVNGEVSVVNGKISLGSGSRVADDLSNVNGEISLRGAEVGGDLTTVNGDVSLLDGSTVVGNLTIEEPDGWGHKLTTRKPKVIIGPGSAVSGAIVLEREVELYISDSASVSNVRGVMSMADAVRFSGDTP